MGKLMDADAQSPCLGEEQMSLQCRTMYTDSEVKRKVGYIPSMGVRQPATECKHVIENYRNCRKFWTKFLVENGTRLCPAFNERKQIMDYLSKRGSVPYQYVQRGHDTRGVAVDFTDFCFLVEELLHSRNRLRKLRHN